MSKIFNLFGRVLFTIVFFNLAVKLMREPKNFEVFAQKYSQFYSWTSATYLRNIQNYLITPSFLESNIEGISFKIGISLVILCTAIICFVNYISIFFVVLVSLYLIVSQNILMVKYSSEIYANLQNIVFGIAFIGTALMLFSSKKEEVAEKILSKKEKKQQKKKMQATKKEETVEKVKEIKESKKEEAQKSDKKKKKKEKTK